MHQLGFWGLRGGLARIIGGVDKFLRVAYAGMPCDGFRGSSAGFRLPSEETPRENVVQST